MISKSFGLSLRLKEIIHQWQKVAKQDFASSTLTSSDFVQ
ncbi:MAG: hypothetical protein KatS3mg048_2661 [Caldilinea sp.]|jgi:hypothetical protein|nr:MAG: hypothetical protein KatS3mg048_2661 [Caldilinea sp.]